MFQLPSLLTLCPFFLTNTPTPDIYTLSLHDALPISSLTGAKSSSKRISTLPRRSLINRGRFVPPDRKSTRLNSSHLGISYAVFCLKKKIQQTQKHNNLTKCQAARVNQSNNDEAQRLR